MFHLSTRLLGGILLLSLASRLMAASPELMALETQMTEAIAAAEPAVVVVSRRHAAPAAGEAEAADPLSELRKPEEQAPDKALAENVGLGVIIDSAGLVLTSILNVAEGDEHSVTLSTGKQHSAKLIAADPRSALAVLKFEAPSLTALELGEAEKLKKGQFILVFGNPDALLAEGQASASLGTITNLNRKAGPTENLNNYASERGYQTTLHHFGSLIQTDARIGWAGSGGAVIDLEGKLIGLVTTAASAAGHEALARYAIPINATYRRVIEALKEGREAEYGLLGISFMPEGAQMMMGGNVINIGGDLQIGGDLATPEATSSSQGVIVNRVYPGGAADRAGLQPNDRLTSVNGRALKSSDDLQLLVGEVAPGEAAEVEFNRDGKPQKSSVVVDKFFITGPKVVTQPAKSWRGIRVDFATSAPLAVLDQNSNAGLIDPHGCVLVSEVIPDSPAEKAGVQANRYITHLGETRVATPAEFHAAAAQATGEVTLKFTTPNPGQQQQVIQFQGIVIAGPASGTPPIDPAAPATITVPAE